jgi:arginine-tRNA-protein transferase
MVVDHLDDALSSVYTFFDPDLPKRSLGTWAVLWQVAEARRLGLRWVYLGYWIEECRKMAYKGRFRPLERLADGVWRREP